MVGFCHGGNVLGILYSIIWWGIFSGITPPGLKPKCVNFWLEARENILERVFDPRPVVTPNPTQPRTKNFCMDICLSFLILSVAIFGNSRTGDCSEKLPATPLSTLNTLNTQHSQHYSATCDQYKTTIHPPAQDSPKCNQRNVSSTRNAWDQSGPSSSSSSW